MSTGLQLRHADEMNLNELQTLGQVLAKSGFFAETKDAAQAVVKVMAGMELGFPPIASMTGVYIVKGKVSLSANLMAAAIKRSGKYNYKVRELTTQAAEIEFFEDGESIGRSRFTMVEAKGAGVADSPTWQKFPRNMLFARAISNGAKWFCPDIFGGPLYTPDELGMQTNEEGEAIEAVVEPQAEEPIEVVVEPEPVKQVKFEGQQPADAPQQFKRPTAKGTAGQIIALADALGWSEAYLREEIISVCKIELMDELAVALPTLPQADAGTLIQAMKAELAARNR